MANSTHATTVFCISIRRIQQYLEGLSKSIIVLSPSSGWCRLSCGTLVFSVVIERQVRDRVRKLGFWWLLFNLYPTFWKEQSSPNPPVILMWQVVKLGTSLNDVRNSRMAQVILSHFLQEITILRPLLYSVSSIQYIDRSLFFLFSVQTCTSSNVNSLNALNTLC